ncbi:MAG: hypothetical protein M1504_02655 [Candidatus Marsarchaeota archaeon]|nr:hypothetical protein [Candidatus Marsarchaeota archaeon]
MADISKPGNDSLTPLIRELRRIATSPQNTREKIDNVIEDLPQNMRIILIMSANLACFTHNTKLTISVKQEDRQMYAAQLGISEEEVIKILIGIRDLGFAVLEKDDQALTIVNEGITIVNRLKELNDTQRK